MEASLQEKDLWVLVDNLNTRQQCALAVKKVNGIMRCFSKRSRGQQSQGILHLYSAPVGLWVLCPVTGYPHTRTMLTYWRESIQKASGMVKD